MTTNLVSIIIPSRNEPYLNKTIQDILLKATGEIEIVVVLDGYWPDEIIESPHLGYIHYGTARGMRNAINSAVQGAQGEYILKCDAHVMFDKGFDEKLKKDIKNNWVVVPRRYALDPIQWELEENAKYPVDYMYLDRELHGRIWEERNKDKLLESKKIDDLMSSQGSCWFMKKDYYLSLELLDEENYGSFFNEFQEIGLKCWLSGGEVKVNKKTWYAHWHKPKEVGRGYSLTSKDGTDYVNKWLSNDFIWHKQTKSLKWLINKFKPVPTWT